MGRTGDGFNTIHHRRMSKVVKDKDSGLEDRSSSATCARSPPPDDTAEAASKRLRHADPKITERVYRRSVERAKPLR